jgi:hypothetical protein
MRRISLSEWKTVSDIVASWVTIIGLACGGIYTLVEYQNHQKEARVERTFGFVARFGGPELSEFRSRLGSVWESENPSLVSILSNPTKSQEEVNLDYHRFVNQLIKQHQLQTVVLRTVDFLEEVATCVKLRLCEDSAAREFFGRHGQYFFRQYYPILCELRKNWKDESIGAKLERFYNPDSVGQSCSYLR